MYKNLVIKRHITKLIEIMIAKETVMKSNEI